MKSYQNQIFDQERALYGSVGIEVVSCSFEGPADGESALKECSDVSVRQSRFDLRYPFWHDKDLRIDSCKMTPRCRAPIWYSENVRITRSEIYATKALRECSIVFAESCEIRSDEFGWFVRGLTMKNIEAYGEYFILRSECLDFENVKLSGKYSFQYISDSVFDNCAFETKDAFWHAKNVTVRNSVIKGEYLAWYSENVTFENCLIEGTQPFCCCKGLKLINCRMINTDLAFEKSEVEADITTTIDSIRNPKSGVIRAAGVGETIMDDPKAKGKIIITGSAE